MRIFFVGDFETNTGPGIANKMLRQGLCNNNDIEYSNGKNKVSRAIEIIYKTVKSDCVCFCNLSKANIIGIKIAKLLKKKSFYVMHGYLTYETKINDENANEDNLSKINTYEKYIFSNVEKIFCVSKKFMEYMKKVEPDFKNKFDYNYNGIDLVKIEKNVAFDKIKKKDNQIISIGGGMRQKNNLIICKAIDKLNREKGFNLRYVVVGLPYTDKEKICSYDFVTYYDRLPHEKVIRLLSESYLYIQDSSFETFGLSVIEALIRNCNLLISKEVGAIDVIETIENDDLIFNTEDVNEIARKIENILMKGNTCRLKQGLIYQQIIYNETAKKLVNKISKHIGEKDE